MARSQILLTTCSDRGALLLSELMMGVESIEPVSTPIRLNRVWRLTLININIKYYCKDD